MSIYELVWKYSEAFVGGLQVTLLMVLIIWVLGLTIGFLLGHWANRQFESVGRILSTIDLLVSSIPLIAILFFFHYPVQSWIGFTISPEITTTTILVIINIVSVASLLGPALNRFPNEYLKVARMSGLGPYTIWRRIQMPLVLRQVFPSMIMLQVNMLQATVFGSFIGAGEVFRVAQRINAIEHSPVQIYGAVALLFVLICLPLRLLAMWLQHINRIDLSEK